MTLKEAIKVLVKHQKWRLGDKIDMTNPKEITEAIDIALNLMKQLNKPIK